MGKVKIMSYGTKSKDWEKLYIPRAFKFLRITSICARLDGNPNDDLKAEGRPINFDGQPYDPNNAVPDGGTYTAKGSLTFQPSLNANTRKSSRQHPPKSATKAKVIQTPAIKGHNQKQQ